LDGVGDVKEKAWPCGVAASKLGSADGSGEKSASEELPDKRVSTEVTFT
jgi:hypothetical protein